MSAHARLRGYGVVREVGRRMAADPAVRAALRDLRAARVRAEFFWRRPGADVAADEGAYADAGRAVRVAARPHLPPGLHVGAVGGGLRSRQTLALYALYPGSAEDPGWDLHARALERGDVVLLPAPDGSGEVVGI